MNVVIHGKLADSRPEVVVVPVNPHGIFMQGIAEYASYHPEIVAKYMTHCREGTKSGDVIAIEADGKVFLLAYCMPDPNTISLDSFRECLPKIEGVIKEHDYKSLMLCSFNNIRVFAEVIDEMERAFAECFIDVLIS